MSAPAEALRGAGGGTALDATVVAIHTARVSPRVHPDLVVRGARGTHDRSDFLIVRVVLSDGGEGLGEVSATLGWSGEDGASAERVIDDRLRPALLGQPLVPVAALAARMDAAVAGEPFTKAGLSIALWDAYARALGVPLAVALGGPLRREVAVKCSISGDGDRLATTLAAGRAAGFRAYKVKVGFAPEADAARLALARELTGPDTFLGVDANGGWSREQAARALESLRPFGPAFVEQPLAPEDLEGMAALRGRGLPIVADEAVFDMEDLVACLRADAADAVSLYVGKSAGPDRAVAMARVASAFGLDVVIGSNGELGVGAAAQLHVACAAPGLSTAIPSDVIGGHYYADGEDVLAEPLDDDGRVARMSDAPGLGVRLKPDLLERLR